MCGTFRGHVEDPEEIVTRVLEFEGPSALHGSSGTGKSWSYEGFAAAVGRVLTAGATVLRALALRE